MNFRIAVRSMCLSLALAWASASQAQTDNYTGTWYNPSQDGHGLNIERLENGSLLVIWYVYRPDGSSTFLLGIATQSSGTWTATLQQAEGMVFGDFNPATNQLTNWGTIEMVFNDCDSGTLSWTSSATGYPDGSIPIQRLTSAQGANCNDSPWVGNYAMSVDDTDTEDGTAIGFAALAPDGQLMFVLNEDDEISTGRGAWQLSGNGIATQSIRYPEDDDDDQELLNINFVQVRDGLEGSASGNINVSLSRLDSFQDNLTLGSLAGTYDARNESSTMILGDVTISGNGALTGTLDDCVLDGQLSVPNQNFNQAYVSIDVSQCGVGTFLGIAYRRDGTLTLMVAEESIGDASTLELQRR